MLKSMARLFRGWEEADVNYCHWKSTNHLSETMVGRTDVDVLVDATVSSVAIQVLFERGFRRLDTVALRSFPGIADYLCLDEEGIWVHVHLHFQLVLGDRWLKASWLPSADMLRRSYFSDEFQSYVIDPRDELYLYCARMAVKFQRPFSDRAVWSEFEHIHSRARSAGPLAGGSATFLPILEECLRYAHSSEDPSPKELNRLARKVRRSMGAVRRVGTLAFHTASCLRRFYRYWIEFNRRILKRYDSGRRRIPAGGVLVAFIGIDGSGKTSAVLRMENLFAKQLNVERVFLGNGQSGASWYRKIVFAILGSRARFQGHKSLRESRKGKKQAKVPWYYGAWMLVVTADKRKDLRRAIAAKANGSLVLSDRWPQRQIPAVCDGPRMGGLMGLSGLTRLAALREERLFDQSAAVKPDLVVRLTVTPDVAVARKPGEFTTAESEEGSRLLASIDWQGTRLVDVDADQPMDQVDVAIRSAIWDTIQR